MIQILATSINYLIKPNGKGGATQAYANFGTEVKQRLGNKSKVIDIIIFEAGEVPDEKEIAKAVQELKRLNEAQAMVDKMRKEIFGGLSEHEKQEKN